MAQTNYFSVYNQNNQIVINDSYKNLFLSRKIAAETLPHEYISWSTGCYMRGSYLARRIDFLPERDEICAAVAAPVGTVCNFFIFSNIIGRTNRVYLCAAQRTNPQDSITSFAWRAAGTTITGMNDTSYVPHGVEVFVFSKSNKGQQTSEKAGLQVFDANGNCIYDSRYKSARILGGVGFYQHITTDRRIAVGGGSEVVCDNYIYGSPYNQYTTMIGGYGIGFGESSYYGRYCKPISCMAITHNVESSQNLSYRISSNGRSYVLFDVTNF